MPPASLPRSSARRQTLDPAAAPWRELLLSIAVPTVLVAILALQIAHLVDVQAAGRPERLDIFYYLARLDAPAAVLTILSVVGALAVVRRSPPTAASRTLDRALCFAGEHPVPLALGASALFAAGALGVYQRWPLSMDEYSTLFQARAFAAGSLVGRFPPDLLPALVPEFFRSRSPHEVLDRFFTVSATTGEIVSVYWPGFALLLTPFVLLGVPWLLNPLLGGGLLYVVGRLASRLFPRSAAPGWAVALTLASPTFVAHSISFYSMNAILLAHAAYALLLLSPTRGRALGAGVVGSVALTLHNPYPHLLFAAPWIVSLLRSPERSRVLPALLAGYLPLTLLLGGGWILLRTSLGAPSAGAPGVLPWIATAAGAAVALPGTVLVTPEPGIVALRVLEFVRLCLWAVPGLPFLAVLAYRRGRTVPGARTLAWSAALVLAGYLLVPVDQGHGWGSRYFYPAFLALPLLAGGLLATPDAAPRAVVRFTGVLTCASLFLANPLRAHQIQQFIDRQLGQLPTPVPGQRQVVFLDLRSGYYLADLVQNDPFLRGPVIRLVSHGSPADRAVVRRHFPGARPWSLPGPHKVWLVPAPQPIDGATGRRRASH